MALTSSSQRAPMTRPGPAVLVESGRSGPRRRRGACPPRHGDAQGLELEIQVLAEDGLLDDDGAIGRAAALERGWNTALLDAVEAAEAGQLRDAAAGDPHGRPLTATALPPDVDDERAGGEEPPSVAALAALPATLPAPAGG